MAPENGASKRSPCRRKEGAALGGRAAPPPLHPPCSSHELPPGSGRSGSFLSGESLCLRPRPRRPTAPSAGLRCKATCRLGPILPGPPRKRTLRVLPLRGGQAQACGLRSPGGHTRSPTGHLLRPSRQLRWPCLCCKASGCGQDPQGNRCCASRLVCVSWGSGYTPLARVWAQAPVAKPTASTPTRCSVPRVSGPGPSDGVSAPGISDARGLKRAAPRPQDHGPQVRACSGGQREQR